VIGVVVIDAMVETALPNPATAPKVKTDNLIANAEWVLANLRARKAEEKKS
jgi:hypothetical protein